MTKSTTSEQAEQGNVVALPSRSNNPSGRPVSAAPSLTNLPIDALAAAVDTSKTKKVRINFELEQWQRDLLSMAATAGGGSIRTLLLELIEQGGIPLDAEEIKKRRGNR